MAVVCGPQEAVARRPTLGATRTHKLLGQQIQILLSSLHPEELDKPALVATPRERAVIDFATAGDGNTTPRPTSARRRAGSLSRATSMRRLDASSPRPSSSHTCNSAPDRLKPVVVRVLHQEACCCVCACACGCGCGWGESGADCVVGYRARSPRLMWTNCATIYVRLWKTRPQDFTKTFRSFRCVGAPTTSLCERLLPCHAPVAMPWACLC